MPPESEDVVMLNPGGLTVSDSAEVEETDALSVTRAVKLLVPAVAGVPEIMPLPARLKPEGNEPVATDQV